MPGEVSPALRGVAFRVADRAVRVVFYYDGRVSEERCWQSLPAELESLRFPQELARELV